MGFFDERKNVDAYIKMAEGYDGHDLIKVLQGSLPSGSTVLELGMGPGVDLDLLAEVYSVTGSDSSKVFLELYREKHPGADLIHLDAVSLETERRFECLYSNKVLHHLTKGELKQSFLRQHQIVSQGGLLMHTFWYGNKEEEHQGLRFVYYTEEELLQHFGQGFDVVAMKRYDELEADDSFYVLLRKK